MKPKIVMKLRNNLILTSYISLLIPVFVLCLIFYHLFSNNARNSQIVADGYIALQISESLSHAKQTTDTLSRNIIYSPEIQQIMGQYAISFMNSTTGEEFSRTRYQLAANNVLNSHDNNLSALTNMALYSVDGYRLSSTGIRARWPAHITEYPWFDKLNASAGESLWMTAHPEEADNPYTRSVHLAQRIRSLTPTNPRFGSNIGYLLTDVNLEWFLRSVDLLNVESSSRIYLIDGDGWIIGNNVPEQYEGQFPFGITAETSGALVRGNERERYLLTLRRVQNIGWYVVCLSDYSSIMRDAHLAVGICVSVALLLLLIFFFVSIKNADSVVKPITALHNAFELPETGDFSSQTLPPSGIIELNELNSRFCKMVSRLDALIKKVYISDLKEQKLITEVQRSQIEALQMQINPHFIYNTLDSINWMSMMGGNEDVSRMVIALGEVLRFNVSIQQPYTSLEKEIANTERFMYINRIRIEPQLSYSVDIPEELLDRKVLKLLLQPLAENSIRHGMESTTRNCMLRIRVWAQEEKLFVEIIDDGVGMPQAKQEELQDMWQGIINGKLMQDKVGVVNLMKRLYLCYGDKADFHIESRLDEGTRIMLSFPNEKFD